MGRPYPAPPIVTGWSSACIGAIKMPGGSEILLLAAQVDRPVTALALARPHFHALVAAALAGSHFGRQVLQMRRLLAGLVHVAVVIRGAGAERDQGNGGEGDAKQGLQVHGGLR